METLHEKVREVLHASGWRKPCEVDVQRYRHALRAEGYPVHEIVETFLRSYGGLQVFLPLRENGSERDDFHLDPLAAIDSIYIERVREEYDLRTGSALCVIGLYHRGHMVLMMDGQGRVFGGYDETLVKVGESGEEALRALCLGGGFSPVPFLEEDEPA